MRLVSDDPGTHIFSPFHTYFKLISHHVVDSFSLDIFVPDPDQVPLDPLARGAFRIEGELDTRDLY